MAFMVFTQSLFPAPNADVAAPIKTGATSFRNVVDAGDLDGVTTAYANSVDQVFSLVVVTVTVSSLFIWGIGWQDIRRSVGDATNIY
ncbi:hypothetical protein F4779DRAFT_622975 [Xylariaceae sp. FL0662B]|nr:hypothetical protein F4779DRAFT_622975 [Xylariaceae sp. FL0662B]